MIGGEKAEHVGLLNGVTQLVDRRKGGVAKAPQLKNHPLSGWALQQFERQRGNEGKATVVRSGG